MPNKYRQEANQGTRVGGPEKKAKKSFMDRVRELAAQDGSSKAEQKKADKPMPVNPEGKKGSKLQEIQERANRIESE